MKLASRVSSKQSVSFWTGIGFVLLFMLIAPFKMALFNGSAAVFNGPIFNSVFWTGLFFIYISVVFFLKRKTMDYPILSLTIWLIPISHIVSYFFSVAKHPASLNIYIHTLYAVFFLLGLYLARENFGSKVLINTIVSVGYALVIYGCLNWFELAHYRDAVLNDRLSNVFQYPNSYAVYLIGILLSAVVLATNAKRETIRWIHISMFHLSFLSLFLTVSRGGILILPVLFIGLLALVRLRTQITLSAVMGFAALAGLLGYSLAWQFKAQAVGFPILVGYVFVVTFLTVLLHRWVQQRTAFLDGNNSIKSRAMIPFILLLGSIITLLLVFTTNLASILPENLGKRITAFSLEASSAISRASFVQDAFEVIADHPLVGGGGGAWSALYESYQSYPYTSRQVHNFYLQYAIEVGIAGLIILLAIIVAAYCSFYKRKKYSVEEWDQTRFVYPIFVTSIFVHSMIDFDLSYVYLGAITFLCLGAMASPQNRSVGGTKSKDEHDRAVLRTIYPAGMLIIAVALTVTSFQQVQASYTFTSLNDRSQKRTYEDLTKALDTILSASPHNLDYIRFKVGLLRQMFRQTESNAYLSEAISLLQVKLESEPNSRQLRELLLATYMDQNDLQNASRELERLIQISPWEIKFYEQLAAIHFNLGLQEKNGGGTGGLHWSRVEQIYGEVESKRQHLLTLSDQAKYEGRKFRVTASLAASLGKVYFLNQDYEQAHRVMKDALVPDFDEQYNVELARWYLAALIEQGKMNQDVYDKLVKAVPEEEQRIAQLVDER